jgi:hypothetical protein
MFCCSMAVMSPKLDEPARYPVMRPFIATWWVIALVLISAPARSEPVAAIAQALDAFHTAAARADFSAYSGLMTENVVFLGTDSTERWQGETFRAFAKPYFDEGRGWTYLPQERHIDLLPGSQSALFDELLSHERLGICRGSGLMLLEGTQWKVAQYNLSVPIPNALVEGVAQQILLLDSGGSGEAEASTTDATQMTSGEVEPSQSKPAKCNRKRHKTNTKAGC